MSNGEPKNWLNDDFYTTPKFARQIMTTKHWQETAEVTQCRILSCGETYALYAKHMDGGIYEVRANLTYWKGGKPNKTKSAT